MKKIIFIFIIVSSFSCSDDFLQRGSLTQLAESNFWKTEKDITLGLNGVYDVLQDRVLYSGNLNASAGLPQYDALADDMYNNYKYEGPGNFMIGSADPTLGMFNFLWTANYKGIGRANAAIENIEKNTTIVEQKKNEYLGQAKFLRGLFYFNLAVYFEDAPLITKVQSLSEAYVPKNTYQELTAQIISDLQFAISSLPNTYPATSQGYATKGAALALLARVQLYNKNYQAVVDLTGQMTSLGYDLNASYAQLFTEAGESSKEIVFAVKFFQDQSNNGETFSATFEGIPRVNMQPMPNLVNDYYCIDGLPITKSPLYSAANRNANRDQRLTASVYFKNDIFLLHLNRAFTGNTATTFGQKKYVRNTTSATGIGVGAAGGQDFYILRYADVLLMRAEALTELNQFTEVYSLVNRVRARSKMPTVESVEGTNLAKDKLLDVVRHERRVEMAMEGHRFIDVKRWGIVEQAYNRAIADKVSGFLPIYRGKKSEVFAIPQNEIDANKSLVQNPNW